MFECIQKRLRTIKKLWETKFAEKGKRASKAFLFIENFLMVLLT